MLPRLYGENQKKHKGKGKTTQLHDYCIQTSLVLTKIISYTFITPGVIWGNWVLDFGVFLPSVGPILSEYCPASYAIIVLSEIHIISLYRCIPKRIQF